MSLLQLWFDSGEKSLDVRVFSVHEAISKTFEASVLAVSHSSDIDLESIVGKPAALRIASGLLFASIPERRWLGICSYMELIEVETSIKGLSTYCLHIVPSLWLLTQRRGYRAFQHKSIPDIVDAVLLAWKLKPLWKIDRGNYPKLEYRVQYGETDYAFLCRLLEEAGIAFTFPHSADDSSEITFSDALSTG
jgi:type VI secretion system secreted protein VgrG